MRVRTPTRFSLLCGSLSLPIPRDFALNCSFFHSPRQVESKVRAQIREKEKAKRRRQLLKKQLSAKIKLKEEHPELDVKPVVERFEWEKKIAMNEDDDNEEGGGEGGDDDDEEEGIFEAGRLLREEKKAERMLREVLGEDGFLYSEGRALRWDFAKPLVT